jgi:ubiquinone/menaquinone biosynthesis C-methylase UbiE
MAGHVSSLKDGVALTDKGISQLGRGMHLPPWATDFSGWAGFRVIDVGAGGGAVVRELISLGIKAVGIDRTGESFQAAGVANQEIFKVADAANLPFPSNDFDAALSAWSVFYYISRGEEAKARVFLTELCRVVKSQGELRLFGVEPRAYNVFAQSSLVTIEREAPLDRGCYPVVSLKVA